MTLANNDLKITRHDGSEFGYVLMTPVSQQSEASLVHSKAQPTVQANVGSSSPTQAGGNWDVRDAEGDKSIAHVDWHLGAGQASLDSEDSHPSRYFRSKNIDVGRQGSFTISRKFELGQVTNAQGPVYAAKNYLWIAGTDGQVWYSDGLGTTLPCTWDGAEGHKSIDPITDFTSDGNNVYFCIPSGTGGVWKIVGNVISRVSETECRHIAYLNGMLWGATDTAVGHFDPTTMVFVDDSLNFMNNHTSAGLIVAGNAVYWVTSQGGHSYVFSLYWNPETDTVVMQQVAELRSGFNATCACGYLSTVYVGGYMANIDGNVGMGAIYTYRNGDLNLLTEIGPNPKDYFVDYDLGNSVYVYSRYSAAELNNRVTSLSAGDDKLIIQTERDVYVWDIDDGGYHHVSEYYSSSVGAVEGGDAGDVFAGLVFDWQAFQASPETYEPLSVPGLAYYKGKIAGPWLAAGEEVTYYIKSDSHAVNPATITLYSSAANRTNNIPITTTGLSQGDRVFIADSNSVSSLDGYWLIHAKLSESTFQVETVLDNTPKVVATTPATAGTLTYNNQSGLAVTGHSYHGSGELETSRSNFHTGALLKDFRKVVVSHEEISDGDSIIVATMIDGVGWQEATLSSTSAKRSIFDIDLQGYDIEVRITLVSHDGNTAPRVNTFNVIWDFVRVNRHQYTLDCRKGAQNGRWTENAEKAIEHIWSAADEEATFEDRFNGTYSGIIEKAEYQQASFSNKEGPSGLVTILVREVE